jgi:hypothetical protein
MTREKCELAAGNFICVALPSSFADVLQRAGLLADIGNMTRPVELQMQCPHPVFPGRLCKLIFEHGFTSFVAMTPSFNDSRVPLENIVADVLSKAHGRVGTCQYRITIRPLLLSVY